MSSLIRRHPLNPIELLTNLSIGVFHDVFLIEGNNEINIKDLFLKTSVYNAFLNQYNYDKRYMLHLHNLQEVEINGGTLDDEWVHNFSSDGKADKVHRHEISDINLLPNILNQKRNLNNFDFRNITENVFVNDLVYKEGVNNKTLSVELNNRRLLSDFNFKNTSNPIVSNDLTYVDELGYTRSLRESLEKLTDAIFGKNDILSDFEKIYELINSFTSGTSFNWNSYFTNPSVNNGLVYGLIVFLQAQIAAAVAPLTDTSDLRFFIPSNDKYIRKGVSSGVNSLIKGNNSNFISIYPIYNRLCFKDNGIKQLDNDNSCSNPYSFFSNLNPLINYKQALILDGVPLEFHNGAAIRINEDEYFTVNSGKYYWNDSTTTSNLSIPFNNFQKQLMFLSDSSAIFYNRLTDKSGKRYVLEDEVPLQQPSRFLTYNYFNDESTFIDNSKKYINVSNTIVEYPQTHYHTTQQHKYYNIFYDETYFTDDSKRYYYTAIQNAMFSNEDNINYTKKVSNLNYYHDDLFIDNTKRINNITNNYYNTDEENYNVVNKFYKTQLFLNEENDFYINNKKNVYNSFFQDDLFIDNTTKIKNITNNYYNTDEENYNVVNKTYRNYNIVNESNDSYINNKKHVCNNYYHDDLFIDNSIKKYYSPVKDIIINNEDNILITNKKTNVHNTFEDNTFYNNKTNKFINHNENIDLTYNLHKTINNHNLQENNYITNNKIINNTLIDDNNVFVNNNTKKIYNIQTNDEYLYATYSYTNNSNHKYYLNNEFNDNVNIYKNDNTFLFNDNNLQNITTNTNNNDVMIYNDNSLINDIKTINNNLLNTTNDIITTNKTYNTLYNEVATNDIYNETRNYNINNVVYTTIDDSIDYTQKFSNISTQINTLNNTLINISTQINNILNSIYNMSGDISNLQNQINTINSTLNSISTQINTINNNITTLTNNGNNYATQIASLNSQIMTINANIFNLQTFQTNITQAVDNLAVDVYANLIKRNHFRIRGYPDLIIQDAPIYWQQIPYDTEKAINFENDPSSLSEANSSMTVNVLGNYQGTDYYGVNYGAIKLAAAKGFYEFQLTIDLMQYAAGSSKDSGTITLALYANNVFVQNYNFYLHNIDYGARNVSLYYKPPLSNTADVFIKITAYHKIHNTRSSLSDPDADALLLQVSGCKLNVVRYPA